jgi:hypothetical protein
MTKAITIARVRRPSPNNPIPMVAANTLCRAMPGTKALSAAPPKMKIVIPLMRNSRCVRCAESKRHLTSESVARAGVADGRTQRGMSGRQGLDTRVR